MRALLPLALALSSYSLFAQSSDLERAKSLEHKGDELAARQLLQRAASAPSATVETVAAYAEFLDRHRDPEARKVYGKLLSTTSGQRANSLARRLVLLDLLAGDREAATRHYEIYTKNGGGDLTASIVHQPKPAGPTTAISIPGPISSFARMAALSPDTPPED